MPDGGPKTSSAIALLREAGIDSLALRDELQQASAAIRTSIQKNAPVQLTVTPAAIAAATRGSFLSSDLGFRLDADAASEPELADLLAQAEVVTVGSQRAWQLKPDARRRVLLQARQEGRLERTTKQLVPTPDPPDAEGDLLRRVLAGEVLDPATLPTEELERLATVSEWLSDTDLAKLPAAVELRRLIAQRELLDPFRILVGRTLEAGSDGSKDRLVGRVKQLERLRAYVGIVPPEVLKHYVTRTLSSLWSTVTLSDNANEPLVLLGIGGMGKSTLIAKFILDHALFPGASLPFVYLDFDRAVLAPRQPLQLLIDIALQLGLWFPAIEEKLKSLRFDLRDAIDGLAKNPDRRSGEEGTRSKLNACCKELRDIVESVNGGRAPVVILLDTFEVVQYDDDAVMGVTNLIAALREPGSEPWTNLRIVIAGRADMPEITTSQKRIVLGPLTLDATTELIRRRNESEELALTTEQIRTLARPLGNSPLDVIIVMNWLKGREADERAKLAAEIVKEIEAEAGNEQTIGPLAATRVTGILIDRMVKHINDEEVRKLAIPGLVVRAVTPDVIRYVMAPAGGLVATPDQLKPGAEDELFRRLERERWLVTRRGKVVRHRPEVRLAMLDLMRRQDKNKFADTNKLALDYFRANAEHDDDARAEAIYHMLLGGETPLEEVDRMWTPGVARPLSSAVDDLGGKAQDYLKARLGRSVPNNVLHALPPSVLASVLRSFGRRMLLRAAPDWLLDLLRANRVVENDPALLGLQLEASYRAGRWDPFQLIARGEAEVPPGVREMLVSLFHGHFEEARLRDERTGSPLHSLLRWATRDPQSNSLEPLVSDFGSGVSDETLRVHDDIYWNLAAFLLCAGARGMKRADGLGRTMLEAIREQCRIQKRLPPTAASSGALHVLAFFETGARRHILARLDFDSHFSTLSGREVERFREIVSIPFEASSDDAADTKKRYGEALRRGQDLLERLADHGTDAVIADASVTKEFAWIVRALVETGSERVA